MSKLVKAEVAEMLADMDLALGHPSSRERLVKVWMAEPLYYTTAVLDWRTAPEGEAKDIAWQALEEARIRHHQDTPRGRATRSRQQTIRNAR